SFDGNNDYVDGGTGSLGGSFTVSCWIKPSSINTNWAGFVNKHGTAGQKVFWIGQHTTNGKVRFGVFLNGTNESALDTDGAVIANGSWYHVAASYDGNYQKIYINGTLVKTSSDINTVLSSGTSNYWIGKSTAQATFSGLIDEVAIWNRALTENEINGQYESNDGPIAYWRFNAGSSSTLYDHSGNQNHGTINGATWSEDAHVPGCTDTLATNYNPEANWDDGSCEYPDNGDFSLSFDGVDDYVEVPHDNIQNVSDELTISAWIKAEAGSPTERNYIVNKCKSGSGTHSDDSYWFYITDEGNLGAGISYGSDRGDFYPAGSGLLDGQWHHVAWVFDRPINSFYIDGIHTGDSFDEFNYDINSSDENIYLGAQYHDGLTNHFIGNIDNVQIWNNGLSEQEIQDYIIDEPSGNEEGLVSYWKFNAGEGETLYDHSGNQNHGTINGAPWVENISGCTDPCLENYNPEANWDDGSCGEFVGCPDNGDYSLSFDGDDDYVDMGSPDLGIDTTATFSAWIYPQAENGVIAMQGFSHAANEHGWVVAIGWDDWALSESDPRELVWASHDNSSNANNAMLVASPALITMDQWQHIAVTKDGTEIKMYLDGQLIHTESIEATTITYNEGTNLRLGTRTASSNGYFESSFNGNLDEVSLWNITLTAEDIQNNMNTSLGGDEDGLAGYWKFDANEGSITFDHTGNQNHGYIIGATWSDDVPVPGCTDT
ncbi:MAG TPA: LamG domain-containing protein, partial [Candidatus Marinimicrobia bacterium]|nr:LamG domain-containing protein [Candidatus Neomarinimicrobiota bacterium]